MLYGVSKYVLDQKCCFSLKVSHCQVIHFYLYLWPFIIVLLVVPFIIVLIIVVHSENDYDERHGEETVILKFFNWEHSWINTICVKCIYRTLRSNIDLIFISDSESISGFFRKKTTSKYYSKIAFKISFQIGGRRSYFVCVGVYMVSTV